MAKKNRNLDDLEVIFEREKGREIKLFARGNKTLYLRILLRTILFLDINYYIVLIMMS